ncbi:MAG TPA: DNA primase [Candidatus Nanoarchaeia archaeon]|nr:DNA primase [Candidatus Nanoarchaeia archaeon]
MSSSVEKIKEKLTITDVVSSYLKLEKAGSSYKGKCPFHNEKTPSFFVSPDRGTYYCFGCGAKGDMFTFVEEFEGLEFKQALVNLAAKAGIELVPEKIGERDERDRLFQVVESASEYFESNISKHPEVLDYLTKRGLTKETIAKWRIGFAPNEWRLLHDHLLAKKVSVADMLTTGLIKRVENDPQKVYDVFRGRIMFPIFDQSGRPVAFSGRILVDDGKSPKYLNSPATVLFNKSEVLFGFDRAKTAIRKMDYSILVEGQMDLILSHQAGLANTVASSGTAITEVQLRRLQRISPRIMFALDSDSAGFNATKRTAEIALGIGMEVKVAVLPKGEDPASLVAKDPNLWKQALRNGKHIIDFYTDNLLAKNLDRRVLAREIKSAVLPSILQVQSKTEQAHFLKMIAEKSGIKEDALWDDVKAIARDTKIAPAQTATKDMPALVPRLKGIEGRILGVMFWLEAKKETEQAEKIRKKFGEILGADPARISEENAAGEKDKLIFEAEQYYENSNRFKTDLEELFINLEEEKLKAELSRSMVELHKAELTKDSEKAEKYLTECQHITSKLAAIRKRS